MSGRRLLCAAVTAILWIALSACTRTFPLGDGVGHPWGMALDGAGNLWFAEAGCELPAACGPAQQPGQIGLLRSGSQSVEFFRLPAIPGNQPAFVAVDRAGAVWFTTPRNARIGRFNPATASFEQWPVTPNSGPWHLAFAPDGSLWYTQFFASAIGRFDPVTHAHQDFNTPTPGAKPYGIAVRGKRVWFTENRTGVGRIGMLDTAANNKISEYIIRAHPSSDLTPHLIALDELGNVWWTEGFEGEIGKLTPSQATPGNCGRSSGSCRGVTEFHIPLSACGRRHGSAIATRSGAGEIWFTDSLSGEVGRLTAATGEFRMYKQSGCDAHAHDGIAVDAAGVVWWAEEFFNQIIRFVPPE